MVENNTNLTEDLVKTARNKYLKEWRAKNKDKIRKYNQTYWSKKAREELSSDLKEDHNQNGKT